MDITQPGALPNPDTSLEPVAYYNDASGANFTLDGPMARAYGEALDELFKKEIGPDGLTLESVNLTEGYQNSMAWKDYNWLRAARGQMTNSQTSYHQLGMLYGVGKRDLNLTHFQEMMQSFSRMSPDQRLASAVILDENAGKDVAAMPMNQTNIVTETFVELVTRYCTQAPRIPIYPSLQAFIKARS